MRMPPCPMALLLTPPPMCSLYVSGNAGGDWHLVPISNTLSIYVSGMMAWDSHVLLFGSGSILRSTDHGSTWQTADSDFDYNECTGGQLIPGAGAGGLSSPTIYAWCYVDDTARLLKVRV